MVHHHTLSSGFSTDLKKASSLFSISYTATVAVDCGRQQTSEWKHTDSAKDIRSLDSRNAGWRLTRRAEDQAIALFGKTESMSLSCKEKNEHRCLPGPGRQGRKLGTMAVLAVLTAQRKMVEKHHKAVIGET